MLRLFKNNKVNKEKKNIIPRYITFLILSIILGGIFTALTSYAATIAATNISYSNTTSGLTATNAQAAIDEIYNSSKPVDCSTLPDGTPISVGGMIGVKDDYSLYWQNGTEDGNRNIFKTTEGCDNFDVLYSCSSGYQGGCPNLAYVRAVGIKDAAVCINGEEDYSISSSESKVKTISGDDFTYCKYNGTRINLFFPKWYICSDNAYGSKCYKYGNKWYVELEIHESIPIGG